MKTYNNNNNVLFERDVDYTISIPNTDKTAQNDFIQKSIILSKNISINIYSQGPKVIPQKYFPLDFNAFTCLQEN